MPDPQAEQPKHSHSGGRGLKGMQIVRVRGIPVQVHWSLVLALPVFAFVLGFLYFPAAAGVPVLWSLIWGIVMAVVLFGSVLLHELSHSLTALRYGINVERIILLPIGGLSQMEDNPEQPKQELAVTVMGPVTNFVIAAPFVALTLAGVVPELVPGLGLFLLWVGAINVLLGVFNLFLPAFPMDGGRVLRSLLAMRVGRLRATVYAATTGRVLAVMMGLFGLFVLGLGGILLIVIAVFIFMGATMERNMARYEQMLGTARVKDLMTDKPIVAHPDDTMEDLLHRVQDTKHFAFPVVDQDHHLQGCITVEDMRGLPPTDFSRVQVGDRMRDDIATVEPDLPASEALRMVLAKGNDHVAVVDHGEFIGFLTRTDMERAVQISQLMASGPRGRL
jgi:Zn-dependent protease/predicted transcriptional regulator